MTVSLSNPVLQRIQDLTTQLTPRLIEIRRHLHAHPELSGQEHQTAAYLAGVLYSLGLKVRESVGRTGLVAELPGHGGDERILAIRTDMDALPIPEQTGLPYSSLYPGIMHACGHDIHSTVGVGTAMVLATLAAEQPLPGTVRFLFQPAEEITQGARWMINAGVLAGVNGLLGVHVFPSIPVGCIGTRCGALTAAADDVELTILGESGHGARPHEAIDALWIAVQVVTTLQQAISRTQNPLRPIVLTFGQINGGRAANVIADRVTLKGTARSLHPQTHAELPQWLETIVAHTCQMFGAKYELKYERGTPSVQNDPALTDLVERSFVAAFGCQQLQRLPEPSLGAEDFGVYLDRVPGSMFRLGVGHPDPVSQPNYSLHHPKFNPEEGAIAVGVVTLAQSAYQYWS
ncbi:MAG: M20 family metallopeptidase [Prochlorotrichaceae cyanobacterium]|jgi:amidohydrolase